jgi:hypothetical protein
LPFNRFPFCQSLLALPLLPNAYSLFIPFHFISFASQGAFADEWLPVRVSTSAVRQQRWKQGKVSDDGIDFDQAADAAVDAAAADCTTCADRSDGGVAAAVGVLWRRHPRLRNVGECAVENDTLRHRRERDAEFRAALLTHNRSVVDAHADGNCMFRAFAHQIYGDEAKHAQVRRFLSLCLYLSLCSCLCFFFVFVFPFVFVSVCFRLFLFVFVCSCVLLGVVFYCHSDEAKCANVRISVL